jgi:DNA-binding transcriptional LysR family regulator
VTITASIGVAGLWLLPRLGDFQRRHPEVDVRVAASNNILNLPSEQIDLAIRYCSDQQAPRGAVRLFGETIAPVAAPSARIASLDTERALARSVLLEYEDRRHWLQWSEWLDARGWSARQAKGILRFNQYDQVIHAAVAGQGVALGRLELLAPMLQDGRLIVVDGAAPTHYAYWLVQADATPRRDVAKVIDWIREEAGQPALAAAA